MPRCSEFLVVFYLCPKAIRRLRTLREYRVIDRDYYDSEKFIDVYLLFHRRKTNFSSKQGKQTIKFK